MKTAEEMLRKEFWFGDCPDSMWEYDVPGLVALMKEYAVFVAQRALNHASEIALMTFHCGTFKVNTPTKYHQMGADNFK